MQEVEKMFGSTYDSVKRFVKASAHVRPLLRTLAERDSLNVFDILTVNEGAEGVETLPGLNKVLTCFSELREMKAILEENLKPIVHLLFSCLERVKERLESLFLGVASGPSLAVPHSFKEPFSPCTLKEVNSM